MQVREDVDAEVEVRPEEVRVAVRAREDRAAEEALELLPLLRDVQVDVVEAEQRAAGSRTSRRRRRRRGRRDARSSRPRRRRARPPSSSRGSGLPCRCRATSPGRRRVQRSGSASKSEGSRRTSRSSVVRSSVVVREKVRRIDCPRVVTGRRSGGPPSGAATSANSVVSSTDWTSPVRLSCLATTRRSEKSDFAMKTLPA